ncbi:MAG: YitT family protein [Waddliaceae bacterium]
MPLTTKTVSHQIYLYLWIAVGALLAAFAIEVFFLPNRLIDGGIIGISMMLAHVFGKNLLPFIMLGLTIPFLYFAYKQIGKIFILHMIFAVLVFDIGIYLLQRYSHMEFTGDPLEVVVIGGAILGIGVGLIIRYGGCIDGTEILGIIINRRLGISVGQVVLFCNIFIFAAAGLVFNDWHPPILSLIAFMVATRVMDSVIVGLEETKSVLIISPKSKEITAAIIHEIGLGLTVMYGRGGYSGDEREILYVIAERLQLSELKELIFREDPMAFIAIENLHEVSYGMAGEISGRNRTTVVDMFSKLFSAKGWKKKST